MTKPAEPYVVQKDKRVYVLYLSRRYRDDPMGNQCAVFIYAAKHSTKRALGLLLEEDGIVWVNDNHLTSESGIVIEFRHLKRGEVSLRQVWEHEYSLAELGWSMQNPHRRDCLHFRHNRQPDTVEPKEKRERKASTPRSQVPAGYVHVSDIALQLNIEPKAARVALRKIYAGDKPKWGWWFSKEELPTVKAKIMEVAK